MKKINKLLLLLVLIGGSVFTSCETTDLDLTSNPNALSPEQADPDFLLNGIQINFAYFAERLGGVGGSLTRIDYMSGRDYNTAYGPTSFNGTWSSAYSTIMQDLKVMNSIAVEKDLVNHIAIGKVLQAYVMISLVDYFGDVPYTESILGSENLNPNLDSGADVYAAALSLLNEAIAGFDSTKQDPQNDFYYDGDWDKWIKAANTLKMKAYITTRLVDASAVSKFNTIVASGNYIASTADDFQFRWGTNEVQPDSRHPRYAGSYTSTGGGRYMSNSLMDYMTGLNDAAYSNPANFDIRVLYYFYRQVSATPGVGGQPADEETLECGLIAPPIHYTGYTYCGVPKGWWGRDHGNDNGIPPDGFKRTLTGIYPAGGTLDDLTYDEKVNGAGNKGGGITPIMLASTSKFMMAELMMVTGNAPGAKITMFEGIDLSINKVTNFTATTPRFDWIFGSGAHPNDPNNIGPALALQSSYIGWFKADLSADWDGGTMSDKWDILANQFFVSLYGNGTDAYNFYRRTGYPTTLQPNIEPNPNTFPRSMWYPASFANTNANVTQKSGVDVQVFWDNNPATGFPMAN